MINKETCCCYKILDEKSISDLKELARSSERNRARICLHDSHDELVQEMLICLYGYSYFRPHKHPASISESYHLVEGKMDIYLLSDNGELIEKVTLEAMGRSNELSAPFYYKISKPIYHFVVPRSEFLIYHEVLTGPWNKESNVIEAPFSPEENDLQRAEKYLYDTTGNNFKTIIN